MGDNGEFKVKDRKSMSQVAEKVAGIEDHLKRIEATTTALQTYYSAREKKIADEHKEPEFGLLDPAKEPYKKLFKVYGDVKKAREKGEMKSKSIDKFVQEIADVMMPNLFGFKAAAEEMPKELKMHNVQMMRFYLDNYDASTPGKEQGESYKELKKLIKDGHASEAAHLIMKAVRTVKQGHEFMEFLDTLFPTEIEDEKEEQHYQFMLKAAEHMAEKANKDLGPNSVSSAKLAQNRQAFVTAYQHYAHGDYQTLKKLAPGSEKAEGKGGGKE